jgi:hypothetical protein
MTVALLSSNHRQAAANHMATRIVVRKRIEKQLRVEMTSLLKIN